ncbi:MAG: hypothetical protein ACYC7B_12740 [Burkholderiales bacterium]
MKTEDLVVSIRQARELIVAAIAGCVSPQIETMLRNADMELHLALWNLGEAVSLRPELDYLDQAGQ